MFEDIDKAPSDVLSIILPLLEGSSLFMTGFGEVCDSVLKFHDEISVVPI